MESILLKFASTAASADGLDPVLVMAVVEQESGWNEYLTRFEKGFMDHIKYGPVVAAEAKEFVATAQFTVSYDTERYGRCVSWGLMQVLGQVARERGFNGPLAQLCDPKTGLKWGCAQLKRKLVKANYDVTKALLAYNGGGRPAYAAEVLARMKNYNIPVGHVEEDHLS